ncbi:MAG: response regulator transcription factor [SAR202 cluster bacterium]|nr:response regulator transcription factor [SAR202 cluster bacterium]
MDVIRILVADDHTLFRKGLRSLLESMFGLEVVGEATAGPEAVALAEKLVPDVVLMDIKMPGLSGIEATKQIIQENSHIGIILVTMFDDAESVYSGMRAGARGYVLKGAEPQELRHAIEAAYRGEVLLNPAIASKLLRRFHPADQPRQAGIPYEELTPRELEVLRLAAEGLSNKEIAHKLVLSEKTIKNRISNIFAKLRVNDRTQAVLHALRTGLVRLPDENPS